MKSSLTTYMKNKNRCHGSAPVFGICVLKRDFGAQRSQWMWDAVSGCGMQPVDVGRSQWMRDAGICCVSVSVVCWYLLCTGICCVLASVCVGICCMSVSAVCWHLLVLAFVVCQYLLCAGSCCVSAGVANAVLRLW